MDENLNSASEGNSEQFLRKLVENCLDGILVIDAHGLVRYANPAARDLFENAAPELENVHFEVPAADEITQITIPHKDQPRTVEMHTTDITWQGAAAQLAILHDTTEQANINQELRERECLLRETNRMARVGGWALDLETGQVWWSEVTRQIHEVPEDFEPQLAEALDFFPQPGREDLAKAIAHTRQTGEPYDMELPFVTYQGRHLWTRAYGEAEMRQGQVVELRGTFQDITERKQAELALKDSERRYRKLFENDIHGFALIEAAPDDSGKPQAFIFKEINRAYENFLGMDRADVIGKPAVEVLPELRDSQALEIIREVAQTGDSQQFEYYSQPSDRYFMVSTYRPMPGQVASIFNEITEQKKAEQELRRSENKFRTLYETMALGALYITKDLEIHTVNPAAEEILGRPAEEIASREYTNPAWQPVNLAGQPLPNEERPSIIALREGVRVEDYVYGVYNPKKQKTIWMSVNVVPQFREGEEEPYQAFSTFSDITERVEAERDLRKSEEKFRTLYEEMAQGVVYQNAEGKITSANPAAERILGLSRDQLLGKESYDEDWQAIRQNGKPLPGDQHPAMISLRTGKRVEDFVFGVKNPKRNQTVWINVNSAPQFREGEETPYQVFTTFLDITDLVRIQHTLEERVKELRCLSNISQALQDNPDVNEICRITVEELVAAMQYPEIAKAVVDLTGEHFEADGFSDGAANNLSVPIKLRGEKIGRVRVAYVEDKDFLLPEEKNLLLSVSETLASYYDRRQTHQQLRASEERFRSAIMEAPNPVAIYAEDGEIITLNAAWSERSGYELEQIPTVSDWLEKAYGERAEGVKDRIEGLFEAQEPVDEGEQRIRVKDGSERIWYYRSAPLGRLPDGRRTVISIAMDVTERVMAQEQLQASEKRFRRAFVDAPVPIMIHAEDGEVININETWTELSGYTPEDIPTIYDWTEKAYGARKEEIQKSIQELYALDERRDEGKFTIRTKDGDTRDWLFSSAPLGWTPDGRRTVISIGQDITDRERYLRRLESLSEIDRTLNESLNLEGVLSKITSQLTRVLEFETMSVMMLHQDCLRVIACQGFETCEGIIGLQFPNQPQFPNNEVIEKRQPIAYADIQKAYPAFTQPTEKGAVEKVKSWMGVPLIREGEVIGMFTIDRTEIRPFTEDEMEIAFNYANRAAVAIHNAQLYQTTRRQLKQLGILRKIDSLITSSLTLDQALPVILRHIQRGLAVDAAAVYLYDQDTNALVHEESLGIQGDPKLSQRIPVGQGFIGRVAETHEPLFIPEVDYAPEGEQYPIVLEKEGIISYYGLPMVAKGNLIGVLELFHRSPLDPDENWYDFAETLGRQAAIAVDNITLFNGLQDANQALREAYDKTIEGWAKALELRDQETQGHSQRLVDLCLQAARQFGFDEAHLPHIRRGVLLHDIGKMGIPDAILRKPGPLNDAEWEVMRQHPVFAYNMLKEIDYLEPALTIPLYHHERWDGSGYPEGLEGEDIPLEARIFSVVDIWDALTSDRPYRAAWSEEKTLQYLQEQAGKELDPHVVEVFLEIIQADREV